MDLFQTAPLDRTAQLTLIVNAQPLGLIESHPNNQWVLSFSTEPALAFHAPEKLLTFLDQVYDTGGWQIGIDFTTAQETEFGLQHDRGAES
ncbi:hypothetical protein [Phormidesmis sp. 146-33]